MILASYNTIAPNPAFGAYNTIATNPMFAGALAQDTVATTASWFDRYKYHLLFGGLGLLAAGGLTYGLVKVMQKN